MAIVMKQRKDCWKYMENWETMILFKSIPNFVSMKWTEY